MTMIHFYNGGEGGDPRCLGTMYPRPAPCPDDRFGRIAYEKFLGKAWVSRTIDTCDCTFHEALMETKDTDCPTLEVGDQLGMVIIPTCMILDSKIAYHIRSGIEGVTFNLVMADVDCTDLGANPVTIGAIDAGPIPAPPFEPPEACERVPLDVFCEACGGEGPCGDFDLTEDVVVPVPGVQIDVSDAQDGSVLITTPASSATVPMPVRTMLQNPKYFYLEVTGLPEGGFDCTKCCLEIMLSVGVDETRRGE